MNNPAQVLYAMIADPAINGQHVDVDHAFGGQCWDLVELFAERLGVPKEPWAIPLGPNGDAYEAWTYYEKSAHMQKYFDKVPAGQQQKGDITIYWKNQGDAGHIAISLGGNTVFEENADPDGAPAHVQQNRASTYLLGALRLKGGGQQEMNKLTADQFKLLYYMVTGKRAEDDQNVMNNIAPDGMVDWQQAVDNIRNYSQYKDFHYKAEDYDRINKLYTALQAAGSGDKVQIGTINGKPVYGDK